MTGASPRVTTVIPTYRRPHKLKRAIRSVLNQTYPHFRVAVFDNASGDETAEVVAQFMKEDPRVTYHCHPENIGMVNNFNYAMLHVETPFFSLLSDDDLLLPQFYEIALAGFERHPDAMLSTTTSIALAENGGGARITTRMPREGYYTPPEGLLAWQGPNHPYITGNLWRRSAIDQFGVMSDTLVSDFDLELRIVSQAPYVVSFQPGALFITHASNATKLASPEDWWHSYQIIRRTLETAPNLTTEVRAQALENIYTEYIDQAYRLGLLSAIRGNHGYARSAAGALRQHYQQEKRAARLELAANLLERIAPLRLGVSLTYGLRRMVNEWKNRPIEKRYRSYVLNG
jgi:glycosyltransferase involved in cell wall biosynthesis